MLAGLTLLTLTSFAPITPPAPQTPPVGVPNFSVLESDRPSFTIVGNQLKSKAKLFLKDSFADALPLFSINLTFGLKTDETAAPLNDPSENGMELTSLTPELSYYGYFERANGTPYCIIRDERTKEYWLHGRLNKSFKAKLCKSFNAEARTVSNCASRAPVMDQKLFDDTFELIDKIAPEYIEGAETPFLPRRDASVQETRAQANRREQNLRQLQNP